MQLDGKVINRSPRQPMKKMYHVIRLTVFCAAATLFLGCSSHDLEIKTHKEPSHITIAGIDFDVHEDNGRLFIQDSSESRLRVAMYVGTWEVDARIMFFRKPRKDPYSAYFDDEMVRRIGSLLLNLFRLPRYNARIEPADAPGFPTIGISLHVRDGQDVFVSKARLHFPYRGPKLEMPGYPPEINDTLYWNQRDFGFLNIDMFGCMQATRQGVVRAGVHIDLTGRDDFNRLPYYPGGIDSPWFQRDVDTFADMAEHWVKLCVADLVFVFDQVPKDYPRDRLMAIKLALLADPRLRSGMTDREFIDALRRPADADDIGALPAVK